MADPIVNRNAERFIPIARPTLGRREEEAATKAIRSGWISAGPLVEKFESEFAAAHGRKYGVACNSGTTALHLALSAMDLGNGRRVALPTMGMIACANAILYCGAVPVFVDSGPHGNAEYNRIPYCSAVLCAHLYGMPASSILTAPPEKVIEDCAECHYAEFAPGIPIGSHGKLATFSFYGNKIISTGEGGMVLCDSRDLAERLRHLRAHAFSSSEHFNHTELAFGYRMTEVQAAIGLAQHEQRHEFLAARARIRDRYQERLGSTPWLRFLPSPAGSVAWLMHLQIVPKAWTGAGEPSLAKDAIRQRLADAGVETRTWFRPLHMQEHLKKFAGERSEGLARSPYFVAECNYAYGICLPIFASMSMSEVDYISDRVISAGAGR